jgi:hypothetical protein
MAWLYDLSFSFFVLIAGAAVLASGVSLVLPALFSNSNNADPNVNWNVIAIVGSYFALVRMLISTSDWLFTCRNPLGHRVFGNISQSEDYHNPEVEKHPTEGGCQ